jgi:RNA polymerase sigma-70 factor, ECF subfamily
MARATAGDLDERSLIEASQRDPRRFAELYEANFERVYAFIVARVRDRSEAEDVTSEVFHQALANLARFEWRGVPFAAWLYRIAANAIADRAQRAGRERPLGADEPAASADFPAATADFEETELCAKVFRLVKELPAEQSKVIEMRFAGGASIREVAKHLGRSEGAVKQLQYRGLQTLRDRLGETDA